MNGFGKQQSTSARLSQGVDDPCRPAPEDVPEPENPLYAHVPTAYGAIALLPSGKSSQALAAFAVLSSCV